MTTLYRYCFNPDVPSEDVEGSLLLAKIAAENLHGESQAQLDIEYAYDPEKATCVIDSATPAGQDLNRLFAGFLRREFGPDAFRIERLHRDVRRDPPLAAEPAMN
jgi:hypothetical protein